MATLDEYCAAAKEPVVTLLGLMFDIQMDAKKLDDVVRHLDTLIAAESLRPAGLSGDGAVWEQHGSRVLNEMRAAAQAGNAQKVWELFSDQQHGLYLLGNTCQGRAGW